MPNLEMLLNLQVHILKRRQLGSVLSSCLNHQNGCLYNLLSQTGKGYTKKSSYVLQDIIIDQCLMHRYRYSSIHNTRGFLRLDAYQTKLHV